jgi:hypothetical protein
VSGMHQTRTGARLANCCPMRSVIHTGQVWLIALAASSRYSVKACPADHVSEVLPCPILGARWEQQVGARCGQTRSGTVIVAASVPLTCANILEQASSRSDRSVVVLAVAG